MESIEKTERIQNLAILGGDAVHILRNRIIPLSISEIFVNHPEPPERISGGEGNQGKSMLTTETFLLFYKVLKDEGKITIVTDNLLFAKLLISIVANLNNECFQSESRSNLNFGNKTLLFESVSLPEDDSRFLQFETEVKFKSNSSKIFEENSLKRRKIENTDFLKQSIKVNKIKNKSNDTSSSSSSDSDSDDENNGAFSKTLNLETKHPESKSGRNTISQTSYNYMIDIFSKFNKIRNFS
jgi:tRNA G46 methylase TrmB